MTDINVVPNGESLNFDLSGLEDKWSIFSQDHCCDCGKDITNECPMRFWKGEGKDTKEIALCWECGHKRLKKPKIIPVTPGELHEVLEEELQ